MAKIDWKASNIFELLQQQVKGYNSAYNLKDVCIANQAAPAGVLNDVYYYTGDVTATVFGIAGIVKNSFLRHNGAGWEYVGAMGDLSQKVDKASNYSLLPGSILNTENDFRNVYLNTDEGEDSSYFVGPIITSKTFIANDGSLFPANILPKVLKVDYSNISGGELKFQVNSPAIYTKGKLIFWVKRTELIRYYAFFVYRYAIDSFPSDWLLGYTSELLSTKKIAWETATSYQSIEIGEETADYVSVILSIKRPDARIMMLNFETLPGQSGSLTLINTSFIGNVEPSAKISALPVYRKNSGSSFNNKVNNAVKIYMESTEVVAANNLKTAANDLKTTSLVANTLLNTEINFRNFYLNAEEGDDNSYFAAVGNVVTSKTFIANDGSLFPANILPKVLKVDYNKIAGGELSFQFGTTSANLKGKLIFWIKKTDLLKFPSIGLFRAAISSEGTSAVWLEVSPTVLLSTKKVFWQTATSYHSIEIVEETTDYVSVISSTKRAENAQNTRLFKFTTDVGNNGTITLINISYIDNIEPSAKISALPVYRKNSGSSFAEKALKTVTDYINSQQLITEENVDAIVDEKLILKSPKTYGGNIQRALKKLADYKIGMANGKVPKIILLADSITGGSWAVAWKTWMEAEYGLPTTAIEIHWYGGYPHERMIPFIDNLIQHNPDLFIYNEYEGLAYRSWFVESTIQLLRSYTSCDIALGTWSMNQAELRARIINPVPVAGSSSIQLMYYKNLARIYNCELIDFNQSILNRAKELISEGMSVDDIVVFLYGIGNTSVHLSSQGYMETMLPEIKSHFGFLANNENMPYPLAAKEEMIMPWTKSRYSIYNDCPVTFNVLEYINTLTGLTTSTAGAQVVFSINDAIGFELLLGTGAGNATIELKKQGDANFIFSSALRFKTFPLQFATEIRSLTYASDDDAWRMKRPFMKAVVTDNINVNGVLKSGQYKIVVTSVTLDGSNNQVVKCIVKDPSGVQIGAEFTVGLSDLNIGNLYFPLKWNGEDNWLIYNTDLDNWGVATNSNWMVNDEYGFYIMSNWVDTINKAAPYHRVFGFERGNYEVRLTNVSGVFSINGMNILK